MSESTTTETQITGFTDNEIRAIRNKSAYTLTNNPSADGLAAETIRARFWEPIVGEENDTESINIISVVNRIVKDVNERIKDITGRQDTFEAGITTILGDLY